MNKDHEWIAPLVRTVLGTRPMRNTSGPIYCPICECDHQIFQGMGTLCPDKTGTKLVCAFPTTETMVKIDMPPDIRVGGTTTYVRFRCGCHGHYWGVVTTYHKDRTIAWCADFNPKKKKSKKMVVPPLAPAPPEKFPPPVLEADVNPDSASILAAIEALLKSAAAAGNKKPVLLIGQDALQHLPPDVIAKLKAQGAQFLDNESMKATSIPVKAKLPAPQHPLKYLLATVRYAWQNWKDKLPLPEEQILNFLLPVVPLTKALKTKAPHLAVGTIDSKVFNAMQEWLLALAVEVSQPTRMLTHGMVYWQNLLLVITKADTESRRTMAADISNSVIGLNRFKPDIYFLTPKDYNELRATKAAEAVQ